MSKLPILILIFLSLIGCGGNVSHKDLSTALFYEGVNAFNKGNYKRALEVYSKLGNEGHAPSQFNMGLMYEKGKGVEVNYRNAYEWYSKAATQGQPNAQNNLGAMYAKGLGINQDYTKAIFWFKKAANQGDKYAQYSLGMLYDNTPGVKPDYIQAEMWFKKSCRNGYQRACDVYQIIHNVNKDMK